MERGGGNVLEREIQQDTAVLYVDLNDLAFRFFTFTSMYLSQVII
jgi:hypothetical protein